MTASVMYLQNALCPQKRRIESIKPCAIKSLAPKWDTPFIALKNGQAVLRKDWGKRIKHGDVLAFVDVAAMPQGGDSGASDALRIVLVLAVMYYTMGSGGGWLLGAAGSSTAAGTFGAYALQAGAMYAGMAIVNYLIPPPKPPTPQQMSSLAAASPTYNLQAQGNTARLEAAIPEHFGRHVAYPDFAAQPYLEYAGNEQYLYQLLCIGRGSYDIEALRIEDTLISSFDDITYEVIQPNGTLSLFPANVITSVEVSGQSLTPAYLGPFVANAAGSVANFIGIDIIAPRGLFYANDDGSLASVSAGLQVETRLIDDLGAPLGDWVVQSGGTVYSPWSDWTICQENGTNTDVIEYRPYQSRSSWDYQKRTRVASIGTIFTARTATPQRYSLRYPVAAGRYEVRCYRTDVENTASRVGHQLVWGGLRAYLTDTRTFGDVTLIAMRMRASNNLSMQNSRKVNVIATRKLPMWHGSVWSAPTATRSIAWALAYACKQVGLYDSQIDLATLLALDSTWNARLDYFDGRIDNFLSFWEAMGKIGGAGRAKPYMQGGVMRVYRDQAATVPVALFSMRNIVKGSFNVDYLMPTVDTADAIDVGYFDAANWSPRRVRAALPGSTAARPAKVEIFGVTSRDQAYREGMYQAASNRYRRKNIKFSTEMEGFIPSFGDLIAIQHDMPAWGQGGEVTAWNAGTRTATLSEPLTWGTGTHYIALRKRDGSVDGPYSVTAGATANDVVLSTSPAITPYVGGTEERTHYSFGWAETYRQPARVIAVRPLSLTSVEIQAVNEDANVHTADSGITTPAAQTSQLESYTNTPLVIGLTSRSMPNQPEKMLVEWEPSPWADHYLVEQSSDGIKWTRCGDVTTNHYTGIAIYGANTIVRVAAVGLARGPWAETLFGAIAAAEMAAAPPAAPTASATGGMFSVRITWSFGDARTDIRGAEIWWSASNDRTTAARLALEPYPAQEYIHVGVTPGQGGYYWLRVADTHANNSAWYPTSATAGLYAAASADPSDLLIQLKNSVSLDQIVSDLAAPLVFVTDPTQMAAPAKNAEALLNLLLKADELKKRAQTEKWVTDATATIDPATGKVTLLATAEISTDVEAHLNQVDLTLGAIDGSIISHTATLNAYGNQIDVAETSITQLQGDITLKASSSYVDSSIQTVLGAIDPAGVTANQNVNAIGLLHTLLDLNASRKLAQLQGARVSVAERSLQATSDALTAQAIERLILAAVVDNNIAAILNEQTARATGDSANATSISTVAAQVNHATTGLPAAHAAVQTEASARATGDSANASSISTLFARLDTGDYAAVKEESSATASALGGVLAKYAVKVDAKGHVIGFELINDGTVGSFVILADKFLIAKPDGSGTPKQVLILGTVNGASALGLDGNLIVDGSIVARSIVANSITADRIYPKTLTAVQIADLAVDTLQLAGNAITVPEYFSGVYSEYGATKFLVPTGQYGCNAYVATTAPTYAAADPSSGAILPKMVSGTLYMECASTAQEGNGSFGGFEIFRATQTELTAWLGAGGTAIGGWSLCGGPGVSVYTSHRISSGDTYYTYAKTNYLGAMNFKDPMTGAVAGSAYYYVVVAYILNPNLVGGSSEFGGIRLSVLGVKR